MTTWDINAIKKELHSLMDEKRYEHTLGVTYISAALAMAHGGNMEQALLAGLLHDCAKPMTHEERLKYCHKRDITVTDTELKNPSLLHAKVGSFLASEKYGIKDEEITNAIKYHTTGHPDMTQLEKIVFIADYIEPLRDMDPDLPEIRKAAFQDLDTALKMILKNTLHFLLTSSKEVDSMTQDTYDYYQERS